MPNLVYSAVGFVLFCWLAVRWWTRIAGLWLLVDGVEVGRAGGSRGASHDVTTL